MLTLHGRLAAPSATEPDAAVRLGRLLEGGKVGGSTAAALSCWVEFTQLPQEPT